MAQLDLFTGKESTEQSILTVPHFQNAEELELFLSRLNVVEIGLLYLGEKLRKLPISPNYRALCPFHKEKTASFYLKPKKNRFACYGCRKDGGPLVLDDLLGGKVYKKIAEATNIYSILPSIGDFDFSASNYHFYPAELEGQVTDTQNKFIRALAAQIEIERYGRYI